MAAGHRLTMAAGRTATFRFYGELNDYLSDHLRFSKRVQWRVPAARRKTPLFVERAVRFEILEKKSNDGLTSA